MEDEISDITAEIENWVNNNKLAKALLNRSSLNKKELMALIIYFRREEISFGDMASELGINRSGVWKRWKRGYKKIFKAFFTLELAVYGGILDPKATKHLMEDLRDYLKLAHKEGDIEAIRERLEKRLSEIEKMKE